MEKLEFASPIKGHIFKLSEVNDPGFNSGAMGEGFGITPSEGKVYAPFDAKVEVLFKTKHAIGLTGIDNNVSLLIHIGLDTVNMNGKGFSAHVKQNDIVKKGDLLLDVDIDMLKKAGYDVTTPVVVTNPDNYSYIAVNDIDNNILVIKDDKQADRIVNSATENTADNKYSNLPDDERVAAEILTNIGSKENIRSVEHCATRLRLILKDKAKINETAIENIEGVKGQFFAAAQYQIILGTGFVDKVYNVITRDSETLAQSNNKETAYADMTLLQKVSRILGDIFVPIIPVLVATGLFMGVRGTLISLGVHFSDNFMLMSQILTDTAFAFLPALVTWSAMKKFGGTPVIGIVLGLMLVAPQLPNAYAVASGSSQPLAISILGLSVPVIGYQGSVLPALVLGIFASKLQGYLKRIVPDVLDLIVTPFLTLLISMILGILIIGPMMHSLETFIFNAVRVFLELPYGIGGFIVGGLQQVVVVSGVHQIFNALEIELLSSTGKDMFNAIITGAIIAQGGAALAVAVRTKNRKKRSLYISSVIPAFLGITEPAIFGINLRFIKPFICGLIGGALSGMTASLMKLAGTGMGITVIPGTLLYMHQLPQYLLVNAIGLTVGFGLTMIFFKPEE